MAGDGGACALNEWLTPEQRERLLNAMADRFSCRSYIGEPDAEEQARLNELLPSLLLPGVRIVLGRADDRKLYRSFPGVEQIMGSGFYAALLQDTSLPHSDVYAGASGEALVLEAETMGLKSCYVMGTFRRSEVKISLSDTEKLTAIIAIGHPARSASHVRKRKNLKDICSTAPEKWPLWAYQAAECVRIAPSALNRQPWELRYSGSIIQLRKTFGATPADMGIALMHLMLGLRDEAYSITWQKSPAIADFCIR